MQLNMINDYTNVLSIKVREKGCNILPYSILHNVENMFPRWLFYDLQYELLTDVGFGGWEG